MDPQIRNLVVMATIGIIAGWLASILVGGGGIIRYLITGIIGSYVGGFLFSYFGIRLGISSAFIEQILVASAGAVVVVLLAKLIAP